MVKKAATKALMVATEVLANILVQPALVGIIVTAILGSINFAYAIKRHSREDKITRAKFGYELTDKLFANKFVLNFLEGIDSSSEIDNVRKVLNPSALNLEPELLSIRNGIDWLLLFLDRVEHALCAKLTDFESVRMPLGFYVALLTIVKGEFLAYANHIGYDRVVSLLDRFESWRAKG